MESDPVPPTNSVYTASGGRQQPSRHRVLERSLFFLRQLIELAEQSTIRLMIGCYARYDATQLQTHSLPTRVNSTSLPAHASSNGARHIIHSPGKVANPGSLLARFTCQAHNPLPFPLSARHIIQAKPLACFECRARNHPGKLLTCFKGRAGNLGNLLTVLGARF
jgi:hypothetical protein